MVLFPQKKPEDTIMWLSHTPIGEHLFTFDGVKIYNFFADYPHHLTKEEVEIFDKENVWLANYFQERKEILGPHKEYMHKDS